MTKRMELGGFYVAIFTDEPNGWSRAHIMWAVDNNKPDRRATVGEKPAAIIIESHGPWGESTISIETPNGYLCNPEMDALGAFMTWFGEIRGRNDAAWEAEKRKGLKSRTRYPKFRLELIAQGRPFDWDDNIPKAEAVRELKRRRDLRPRRPAKP